MLSPLVGLFFYRRHTPPYMMNNSCEVAIGFLGNMSFEASNKKQDESGRILVLDVKVSDNDLLLINQCNANKESEELNTLSTLCNVLGDITDLHWKNIFREAMCVVEIQK